MSVMKKGASWTARAWWIGENGKQHSKQKSGFKTKAAAVEWEKQIIAEGTRATAKTPRGLPTTLRELDEAYREQLTRRHRAITTLTNYKQRIERMHSILGADTRIDALTNLDIQRAVDELCLQGLAPSSARSFYAALRTELAYAVSLGCIPYTPCRSIEMPELPPHKAVIYAPADLMALYNALRVQDHPLLWPVMFAGFHGMRRGEALGVRWQDLDLDEGLLHVNANLVPVSGVGTFLRPPKTRASIDTVALTPETADALRALRQDRLALDRYAPGTEGVPDRDIPYDDLNAGEFICLDRNGRILKPNSIVQALHNFQTANGLLWSGWHDLRHTYATLLCEAEVDPITIQKALRHQNVSTTADMYVHPTTKIKRRATESFCAVLNMCKTQQ